MHLDEDDLRREDLTTLVSTIEEGNTILIKDNDSNGDSHIAPVDIPTSACTAPALEPAVMHAVVNTSGINYLRPLPLLLCQKCRCFSAQYFFASFLSCTCPSCLSMS